jgi:hypothetical protein
MPTTRLMVWGSRTRPWGLISGLGCGLVLVDESAQDRSTPDPAMNRLGNRRCWARRPQPQRPMRSPAVVKSVRGAVPVFRPARFPGPLPEPAVRLSPQRALHKPQVGRTDPLVQLGLDLQYPSSAGRERFPDRRCSPTQPPDLPDVRCWLTGPLRHVRSFPPLGLLRVLRPIPRPWVGNGPAHHRAGCPGGGRPGDGSHVHLLTIRSGRCPAISR